MLDEFIHMNTKIYNHTKIGGKNVSKGSSVNFITHWKDMFM